MRYDFRLGPSDHQIEIHRAFRSAGDRQFSSVTGYLLEFVASSYPQVTEAQAMEFLWALLPLKYRGLDPRSRDCEEVMAFLEWTEREYGVGLKDARAVAADIQRFEKRWHTMNSSPIGIWLEELRLELAVEGLPSTIPPGDPDDPGGFNLVGQLIGGSEGLALWRPPSQRERLPDEWDEEPSAALRNMGEFLQVVGEGVKLTAKGHLRLADGRAVTEAIGYADLFDQQIGDRRFKTASSSEIAPLELFLRWAKAAGLVRVKNKKLLPTARARKLGKDPAADWWLLFRSAVLKLRWWRVEPHRYGLGFWAQDVDEHKPAYLAMAAQSGNRGMTLLLAAEATWMMIEGRWMVDLDPERLFSEFRWIATHLAMELFLPLNMLGAAELWDGAAEDSVRLTRKGQWATAKLALELAAEPRNLLPDNVIEIYRNFN